MSSTKNLLSDLASKLLILFKKNDLVIKTAQTDVLKNILPLNSILSKLSELYVDLSVVPFMGVSTALSHNWLWSLLSYTIGDS